jgi:hypothetical protein
MADEAYRLQIILERREEAKKDAWKAVQAAENALKAEQKKLAQIQEARRQVDVRKAKANEDFQDKLMQPGTNYFEENERHEWYQKAQDAEAVRIDGEIAKQKQQVRRAEGVVEEKKAAFFQASQELEAIVKHKEKWAKQVKREAAEKEQATQEELGEVMWLQQQRDEQQRKQAQQ